MTEIERSIRLKGVDDGAIGTISKVNTALVRQSELVKQLRRENDRSADSVDELSASFQRFIAEEERLASRQRNAIIYDPTAPTAGPAGRRHTPISESSVLSSLSELFSGTRAGQIANTAGDLARLTEQIPRLDGGLVGLLGTIGPLAIGAGVVAAGFAALTSQLAQGKQEIDRNVSALERRLATERLVRDEALTTDEVQKRLAKARQDEADALADKELFSNIDDKSFADAQKGIGDLGARIGTALVSLGGGFNSINEAIDAADQKVLAARAEIRALEATLANGITAANDAAEAEKRLAKERKDTEATLRNLEQQEQALTDAYKQAAADRAQDRGIAAMRQQEDVQRELTRRTIDLTARLAVLGSEGYARVEALRAQTIAAEVKAQDQINALLLKANEEQAAVTARFATESLRRIEQYQVDRQRLEEDAHESILDDIRTGNFDEARTTERNRDKQLKRDQEDFEREQRYRDEDIAQETASRQKATAERIAEITRETDAFKKSQAERIAQEQANTAKSIAAANAAFAEQQTRDAEERRLRNERAEQDQELADSRAERALNAQLQRIQEQEFAETLKLNVIKFLMTDRYAAEEQSLIKVQSSVDTLNATAEDLAAWTAAAAYNANLLKLATVLPPSAFGPIPQVAPGGFNNGLLPFPAAHALSGVDSIGVSSRDQGGGGLALTINTQGMFNGANIGTGLGETEVRDIADEIASYATGQLGAAIKNQFRIMQQGKA